MRAASLFFLLSLLAANRAAALDFRISGQHRLLYRYSDPLDLGIPEVNGVKHARSAESLTLLRNLIGVDISWSPELRSVLQVGGWYALGEPLQAQPPDADLGDVSLAFVEWTRLGAARSQRVRVGRQQLPLGSTRWFSVRDGANIRQSLDLVRWTMAWTRSTLDVFAGVVPHLQRGWFDDRPDPHDQLFGIYATIPILPAKLLGLDLYSLTRRRDTPSEALPIATHLRTTFGLSAGGETDFGSEYIQHTLVQVGERDGSSFVAWGLSAAFWQHLPGWLYPLRVGLRADALSGDKRGEGRRAGTFDPLFPNQTFFSPHPAIYPSNLYSLHPLLKFARERLTLEAGCIFFWRQSVLDAVYGSTAEVALDPNLSHRAFTGAQLSLQAGYEIDRNFDAEIVFARLFAGPSILEAGGRDVSFFGSTLSFHY